MEYTNKQLAKAYLKAISTKGPNLKYRSIAKILEAASIDLNEYFTQHQSLKGINLSGIGSSTISLLESILREGIGRVQTQLSEELEEKIYQCQFPALRIETEIDQYLPGGKRRIIKKEDKDE